MAVWSHLYAEVRAAQSAEGLFRIRPSVRCVMLTYGLTSEINWELDVYLNVGEEAELDATKLNRAADLLDAFLAKSSPREGRRIRSPAKS